MKKINKLSLPATILIASVILGGFYYTVQIKKQDSIEKQARIKKLEDSAREELQAKQQECESLSAGVKKQWNNVMGIGYDVFWKECMVTYTNTKTGEVETSLLSSMKTVK